MKGDELRDIRVSFGMSQVDAARLGGVTRQTIGDWERGVYPVHPLMARVMKALRRRPGLIHDLFPEFVKEKWGVQLPQDQDAQ